MDIVRDGRDSDDDEEKVDDTEGREDSFVYDVYFLMDAHNYSPTGKTVGSLYVPHDDN